MSNAKYLELHNLNNQLKSELDLNSKKSKWLINKIRTVTIELKEYEKRNKTHH